MPRFLLLLTLLAGSVVVPYGMSQPGGVGGLIGKVKAAVGWDGSTTPEPSAATVPSTDLDLGSPATALPPLANRPQSPEAPTRTFRLEEVIRFDIRLDWVYQQWPRASTGLARPDWFGVRVPLVTGTRAEDLAGSLTYYYDADGGVQHISFRGTTGNPQHLMAFLTRHLHFVPQRSGTPGEMLLEVRWSSRVQSRLLVRPMASTSSSNPRSRFRVELELALPGSTRFLDDETTPLPVPSQPVAAR